MRGLYSIFLLIFLLTFFSGTIFSIPLGTKARIEKKGEVWVIDKGSLHGVKIGQEGYFLMQDKEKKKDAKNSVRIAHYKVSKVFKIISYAMVIKWTEGYSAKNAQFAQFIDKLTPPSGTGVRKETKRGEKQETGDTKIELGKDRRWYLETGDREFEAGNYERALKHYQIVLDKDPDDPGAKSREKAAKGKLYLMQGDLESENGEVSAAFEYYLIAFQSLDEKDTELARKILSLWGENTAFKSKISDLKIEQIKILSAVAAYLDSELKENRTEGIPQLLSYAQKFVNDEQLKLRLNNIAISVEILADLNSKNYSNVLSIIEKSVDENDLYKASFIAQKLEGIEMAEAETARLSEINEKLLKKQDQIKSQKETLLKDEKIKNLEKKAANFESLNEFDKAINCYISIIQLEPENKTEFNEKIKALQMKKFEYTKVQQDIKAKLSRDNYLLEATDFIAKELIQDALNSYISAYKTYPEAGKAIDGILKILESCEKEDAAILGKEKLGTKFSKFRKDFFTKLKSTYAGKQDPIGYGILDKITFSKESNIYMETLKTFEGNMYEIHLKAVEKSLKEVDYRSAIAMLLKAQKIKDSYELKKQLAVYDKIAKIKDLIDEGQRKEAGNIIKNLLPDNRLGIVTEVGRLYKHYYKIKDFKTSKLLLKRMGKFDFDSRIKQLIKELKKFK